MEEYSQIVFYYNGKAGADYRMIQLRDKNWSETNILYFRGNDVIDCSFNGLTEGEATLYLTIPASTLATLKDQGLNIQGYGVMLTKVVLINSKKDNEEPGTEPDPEQPDTDPTTTSADWYHNAIEYYANSGKSIWTGKENNLLNWNGGLQLTLQADNFKNLSDNSLIVFCYANDENTVDHTLQLFDGWWKDDISLSDGKKEARQFTIDPSENILTLTPSSATLVRLKERGLVLQGNGAYLKEVLVLDATSISSIITGDANADHKVDIADVVSVITYLQKVKAGKDVDWIVNRKSADVNTTAGVDNGDVKGIADIILAQ